jgi:serine/threonine-protein kinase HipA
MGRKRLSADLSVLMNGEPVGILGRSATGRLSFTYRQDWLAAEKSRPLSLSMPLAATPYTGSTVQNFFDNLLPDNDKIKDRIQQRVKAESTESFDLLWHIGRDCVGAIQLIPDGAEIDVRNVESELLNEAEIADTLRHYKVLPLGMDEDDDFRISIAGAQEKTAFLWRDDGWHRPKGTTPTSHIFKLPIGKIDRFRDMSDSVENEWLCHHIFKAYKIPVADAVMEQFEDMKALVVERFDRRWANDRSWLIRLPQEDFCQATDIPPHKKYEGDGGPGIKEAMDLLLGSENQQEDRRLFMKTQFLFWLLAAIDGHGKNFSIFLLPESNYRLTPMYDIISAHPLVAKGQIVQRRAKMAMALDGKNRHYHWERMLYRHWFSTAKKCGFPDEEMAGIIEAMLSEMDGVIDHVSGLLPENFPAEVADPIFVGMRNARDRITASKEE